jgi:hypothetical protein
VSLGEIKAACLREDVALVADWLAEIQRINAERLLDQAEELFSADAGAPHKTIRCVDY